MAESAVSCLPYLTPACELAREAGNIIMRHYAGDRAARKKDDASPVTDADVEANAYIVDGLRKLAPEIPVVAEESAILPAVSQAEWFWLVDPLDGTRSFVRGKGEFTVNIGLIHQRRPVLGVIFIPAQEAMYYGSIDEGAFREAPGTGLQPIIARTVPDKNLAVVKSQSHGSPLTEAYLEKFSVGSQLAASSSLKFCLVAEGKADLYPRFGKTMEWDTAAGHAILRAAGGEVETSEGEPLLYGKQDFINPYFIAWGKRT